MGYRRLTSRRADTVHRTWATHPRVTDSAVSSRELEQALSSDGRVTQRIVGCTCVGFWTG